MYSPSTHIALSIGAIIRRTTHHSKVIRISHLHNVTYNNPSFISNWYTHTDCTKSYNLENGPIPRPTSFSRKFYMTNQLWSIGTKGYWFHSIGMSPFRGILRLLCLKWTLRLVADVYPKWTLITEDQERLNPVGLPDVSAANSQRGGPRNHQWQNIMTEIICTTP